MTEAHRSLLALLAAVEEVSADAASRESLENVQLLLENHALALGVATQDDESMATALADDVTWTATGESYLAGTWTGRDYVMAMLETSNPITRPFNNRLIRRGFSTRWSAKGMPSCCEPTRVRCPATTSPQSTG